MASQQNTSSTTSSNTPIDAQERVQAWLYRMYSAEFHSSTAVCRRRLLPLSQADFQLRHIGREVLPSAPEPVAASAPVESELSSESPGGVLPALTTMLRNAMNFLLQRRAGASESASADTDSSDATTFSWGCRSPKQPRSLPALMSAQLEAGELGVTESDVSSHVKVLAWAPAPSDEASSDLDSEARFIVARVDNITHDHRERMRDLGLQFSSNSSEPASSPVIPDPTPTPAPLSAQTITALLAQVDHDFTRANYMAYDTSRMSNSRGEYRAELARIEALDRERRAVVEQEYRRLRGLWHEQVGMSNSRGEYLAEMAEIEAMDCVRRDATTSLSSTT
jgi:hypothetical protein